MTQTIITSVILALAVGYAAYRVRIAFKSANDPCYGCKGCTLKKQVTAHARKGGQKKGQNPECYHKK